MHEDDVRDLLARAGGGIPVVGASATRTLARARRDRRVHAGAQVVAVAAAAAAVVLGGLTWPGSGGTGTAPATDSPAPVVPAGTRLVGADGAYVAVPKRWVTEPAPCPTVTKRDTVSLFVAAPDGCPEPYPNATTLQVSRLDSIWGQELVDQADPTTVVDGLEVARVPVTGVGRSGGPYQGALVLPELDLVFALYSPDRAGLDEVLDSLRAVPRGFATVPSQHMQTADDAAATLTGAGFAVDVRQVPGGEAGSVVGTEPAMGSVVMEGSLVTVLVADGSRAVTVPDVTGLEEAEAVRVLQRLGLVATVAMTSAQDHPDVLQGTVVRQTPSPRAEVAPGAAVELLVVRPISVPPPPPPAAGPPEPTGIACTGNQVQVSPLVQDPPTYATPRAAAASYADDGETVIVTDQDENRATAYMLRPDGTAHTRLGITTTDGEWSAGNFVHCAGEGPFSG